MLDVALDGVVSLPSADHPVALEGRTTAAETLAVESAEDGFGAILVHRHGPASLTVGLTVDGPEKLDHVDPAAFQLVGGGRDARPRLLEGAEGGDQFVHLRAEAARMADADRRSPHFPHDCHVLAEITVETQRRMERTTIVARVDDNAGEDIIGSAEDVLPLLLRRLDGHIVAFVEVALDVCHPVKRGTCGFHQCQNVIGLVREVSGRDGIADNGGIVRAEQTVEGGFHVVGAAQRELAHAEVKPAANLGDDFVADR